MHILTQLLLLQSPTYTILQEKSLRDRAKDEFQVRLPTHALITTIRHALVYTSASDVTAAADPGAEHSSIIVRLPGAVIREAQR